MADTDVQANAIFTALTVGEDFSVPAIDLSLPVYSAPDGTGELYTSISSLTEADLTTREVAGDGLFDGLMKAVSAHVYKEYQEGRINSAEYSQVYVSLTQAAMGNAVQYLLGKDNAYWQAINAQKQAQVAEAQVVRARIDAEIAKLEYAAQKADAANRAATYAIIAQKDQVLYETANKIPAEVSNIDADTTIKGYTHTNVLPSQVALNTAETQLKAYDLDWIKPATLTSINEQMEAHRAKTLDVRSDAATVAGTMGKQKELHSQQIIAYERDAEAKLGKMILDTWITQHSVDPTVASAPSGLASASINSLVSSLRASHGI